MECNSALEHLVSVIYSRLHSLMEFTGNSPICIPSRSLPYTKNYTVCQCHITVMHTMVLNDYHNLVHGIYMVHKHAQRIPWYLAF